jgi:hypothetical protein
MTRIEWGTVGERIYEAGVDRGVLYPQTGPGVPWNGLVGVNEKPTGGTFEPSFNDGKKYLNEQTREDFEASIEAFMYPVEFEVSDGTYTSEDGLSVDQQPRLPFGLSYRSLIGDDLQGLERAYKLHIVYNAMAAPSSTPRKTLTSTPDAGTFSWDLTTTPVTIPGFTDSAHVSIDSRNVSANVIRRIEDALYGDANNPPRLLTPAELIDMLDNTQFQLQLYPNAVTGFAKIGDGIYNDVVFTKEPGYFVASSSSRLTPTAEPGISALKES